MKITVLAVLLMMGMAQGYTVHTIIQMYPEAEVVQRVSEYYVVESVIIATTDSSICSAAFPSGITKGVQIHCHAAIPFPTPKGLR